jgi:hypothetical protein
MDFEVGLGDSIDVRCKMLVTDVSRGGSIWQQKYW